MPEAELYKSVLSRAMALCSKSEYCIDDIRTKLHSWGTSETEINKIIAALVKDKFIDERRYAGFFVRDKFKFNKWGKVKIQAHLRLKNISSETIKEALDTIDNEIYTNVLKDLLTEHRKHIKAKNQFDLKGKLMRYGLSKGFESSLLFDLLNDFD